MRALRDISDQLSDRSGVVVHEVVADGSIWYGKDLRELDPATDDGQVRLQHGRDRQVPGRGGADLALDGRRPLPRRDARLHAAQPRVRAHAARRRTRTAGPRATATSSGPAWARRSSTTPSTTSAALYDYADMARSAGQTADADAAEARADELAARFEDAWWMRGRGRVRRLARQPGRRQDQPEALDRRRPDGGRAVRRRRVRARPRLVRARHRRRSPTRENSCYSGERPGNRGLFHTGCGGGPERRRRVRHLLAQQRRSWPSARATTAASAPSSRRATRARTRRRSSRSRSPAARRTSSRARCRRSSRRATPTRRTVGTPPNIDRCWTCRSMFMQAWGHYGTAWAVVHQQLGVRPDLGHGRLEVMPQVPDGQPSVQGADIRLGRGSADVLAAHDGARYTTVTDTGDVRLRTLQIGHTLPQRGRGRVRRARRARRCATARSARRTAGSRCGSRPTRASATRWSSRPRARAGERRSGRAARAGRAARPSAVDVRRRPRSRASARGAARANVNASARRGAPVAALHARRRTDRSSPRTTLGPTALDAPLDAGVDVRRALPRRTPPPLLLRVELRLGVDDLAPPQPRVPAAVGEVDDEPDRRARARTAPTSSAGRSAIR